MMLDVFLWAGEPVRFWGAVVFVFGCIVGSFLNVCIHRLPRDMGLLRPGSHCPHCEKPIPWFRNLPVFTWLWQRGRCAECSARIPARYLLVELLTGTAFLAVFLLVWLHFQVMEPFTAAAMVATLCVLLAGLIAATFIDFDHYIIPDEITVGGMFAGVFFSLLAPELQAAFAGKEGLSRLASAGQSVLGLAVGAGVVYAMVRLGKLLFGRQEFAFDEPARIMFTEHALCLPEEMIQYEDIFYRKNDTIIFHARHVEMVDRCYWDVDIKVALAKKELFIGDESLDPTPVKYWSVVTDEIVIPREAMGFGDVKFMAAIGAFLGWHAVVFTLMLSSVVGSVVGVGAMVLTRGQGRLPYGPYLALAAVVWTFGGYDWWHGWWSQLTEVSGER